MKNQTKAIVLTTKGVVSKFVTNAISHCGFNDSENKIYTGYYNGSGKWATATSAQHTIVSILKAQGYKFERGNDAPRGGVTGEYVKVSKIAFNFIKALKIN